MSARTAPSLTGRWLQRLRRDWALRRLGDPSFAHLFAEPPPDE